MAPRRRIGLTGGIATGKSSVARCLIERHGVPVLDADRFARDALAPGTEATAAVLRRYGPAVALPFGVGDPQALDRAALGRLVFADARERHWLETLVHPLVREAFSKALERWNEAPVVVLMIPLLFEAGLEGLCGEIWVVDCGSEAEQIQRLRSRNPMTLEEAQARVNAQWPMATKISRADVVLDNSGSPEALAKQVALALAQGKAGSLKSDAQPAVAPIVRDDPPTA
ncbi:MAG: dephospho-CoA kinase [Cyanobacteriota bacterium]|jgi:dephospho-CoA kinase